MGNAILCAFPQAPSKNVVKLVHCNGLVEEFYRPVMVGELTPDYPHHFICHSQALLSLLNTHTPPSSSSSCPLSALPALADDYHMQLGQIYFLLPLHSPFSQPSITSLFSKASFARKSSYKDIHVTPFSHEMQDLQESLHTPISHDFFKRLLAEARLQLPATISGPFLINPLENQLFPSSAYSNGRLSDVQNSSLFPKTYTSRDPWRPPLETIIEEGNLLIT